MDLHNESANRNVLHRIANVMFCNAHRTAIIACPGAAEHLPTNSCLDIFAHDLAGFDGSFPEDSCFQNPEIARFIPSERKRHINVFHSNFLCRPSSPGLSQGQTGFVPKTNPVKSPDKPGVVPRPTGQKKLCLCDFSFLPEYRGLQKHIASQHCITRFGKLSPSTGGV